MGSGTPMWQIEVLLFTTGLGSGSAMMPAMSAALGALSRDEVARATTGLNVLLRVGGSIGTALLAVVLTRALSPLLGSAGIAAMNLSAIHNILTNGQARALAPLDRAFGHTFLFSFGTIGIAFIAALFLPRQRFGATGDANAALSFQPGSFGERVGNTGPPSSPMQCPPAPSRDHLPINDVRT
jgi:hypothetical protein